MSFEQLLPGINDFILETIATGWKKSILHLLQVDAFTPQRMSLMHEILGPEGRLRSILRYEE